MIKAVSSNMQNNSVRPSFGRYVDIDIKKILMSEVAPKNIQRHFKYSKKFDKLTNALGVNLFSEPTREGKILQTVRKGAPDAIEFSDILEAADIGTPKEKAVSIGLINQIKQQLKTLAQIKN